MAQPLHSFVPSAGAPSATRQPSSEPRPEQLWIAVYLPRVGPSALASMAAWSLRFTPMVSLEPPEDFLLEVAGSLELFGGLAAIKNALRKEIDHRALDAHLCAAPTARAALWLARCRSEDALSTETLMGRLSPLPSSAARWPENVQALLREMGIRTLGDCFRLSRAGFARRVGRRCLHDLDEALGRQFVPRTALTLPQRLRSRIELAEESTDRVLLAAAGLRMIERLAVSLRRRQAQIQSLELVFQHRQGAPTIARLELTEPAHDERRFSNLIEDKLERLALSAAVVAVGLRTGPLQPMRLRKPLLFDREDGPPAEAEGGSLIERLRSRFGAERVHGMETAADHRPERAWMKSLHRPLATRPSASTLSPWAAQRPLWLLPEPLPLCRGPELRTFAIPCPFAMSCREARAVGLQAGPERIESGWWDGQDAARDYYTLVTAHGERLWVYQQRTEPRGWYLHGIFG